MIEDKHRDLLLSVDADRTPHSGRSLFEHLKGVHDLLRDWDNAEDVCLAGLFHSIYGTQTFKHQSMTDRTKLAAMIGDHAEFLVHCFSTRDRPLFESIDDPVVRGQLMEIEAANLLEQGGNDGRAAQAGADEDQRRREGGAGGKGGVMATREEIAEQLLLQQAPTQITVNPMKQRIERRRDAEDSRFLEYNPFAEPDTDPRGPPPMMGGYPVAQAAPPFEGPLRQPELRSYTPTFRENLRNRLMGENPSVPRQNFIGGLVGTPERAGIADFLPGGSMMGAQEEARKGDYTMAAVAAIPGVGAARKGVKGLTGFAPGSAVEMPAVKRPGPTDKQLDRILGKQPAWMTDESVLFQRPHQVEEFVKDPQRVLHPGVYQDPRVIARQAADQTAPEHPAMKELFGVDRTDLWEIGQRGKRKGNVDPYSVLWTPGRESKGSYAAQAIMTPENAQRQIDVLAEARKYPELARGMESWYVMDPAFQRMVKLVGKEQAIKDYTFLNSVVTPFSSNSTVLKELNRGTGAHMMAKRGEFDKFAEYGGLRPEQRGADFPEAMRDVSSHLRHGGHIPPVRRYLETGKHGYTPDTVKNPLYNLASGVPETGFQTSLPVPDAHLARASGIAETRRNADPGSYMGGSEYRDFGPWYRDKVAKPLGLEAVPAQGLEWGTFSPQTGVKTPVGAPKLELLSQLIWERAAKLGIDPKVLRDKVLLGKEHAAWLLGIPGAGAAASQMGSLAEQREYRQ